MKILSALVVTVFVGAGSAAMAEEDARALMLQARALQRRGGGDNPGGAAALYRKVIALEPESSQAYLRLSESIMEAGNLPAAMEPAQRAAELDPKSGEAWAHLGLLRYYATQTDPTTLPETATALRKAARLLPADPEVNTRLAEVLDTQKDEEGALKAWLAVGRLHPTATYHNRVLAEYAWERAMELAVKLKHYDARREAVMGLCDKRFPEQRSLRFLEDLARDQVDAGFLGHAEDSFRLLAQYVPQEPAIFENIAIIQLRTNRFDAALATLTKAEAMHQTTRLSFNVALCLMKLGRFLEAEPRWHDLLPTMGAANEDTNLLPSAQVLYATCMLLSGRPQDLLEHAATWPATADNPEMLSLRAQALIALGDFKGARAALRDGMARYPGQELFLRAKDLPKKLFDEGLIFKNESRQALVQMNLEAMAGLWAEFHCWDNCLRLVKEARKAAPVRDVELLLLEANALESLGRGDEALEILREGQKLNPGHPTLQNNLGFSLLDRGGDLTEATRLIQAAMAQDPKNSSTMDSWGWVLYKKGKFKESEAALRKAAALSPFSPEIHRHLGEALLKLDRLQEALDEWERALAFAFPERKALEEQTQALRTRLAKSQAMANGDTTPDAPETPAEPEEPADGAGDDL